MTDINETHDPALKSWVDIANAAGCDYPIQNLPFGIFRRAGSSESFRAGVAIGDQILDLAAVKDKGLFGDDLAAAAKSFDEPILNTFMSLGAAQWSAVRKRLSELLRDGGPADDLQSCLMPMAEAEMDVPAAIGDYTDFYASINHATNVGRLFRPDNPLMPNYKYVPIAYHGRSSSICVSGTPTPRPNGQIKAPDSDAPVFTSCERLDYETELGFYIGPGNALGSTVSVADADQQIFGFCILNDWSARDIQAWEYQPLGPFLAKNFMSTISPWIVTMEALAPYRTGFGERPDGDPAPMPHLWDDELSKTGALDIKIETSISTEAMRKAGTPAQVIGSPNAQDLYWSVFQMVAQHSSNGCNLNPGDFLGSGTISGTSPDKLGSILEKCVGGKEPIDFPYGETRTFLEDGDEVIMRAWCEGEGKARIGFGECRSIIVPLG